jgi:hypothetical protein
MDYDTYEKKITELQKKAHQERENNTHEHTEAMSEMLRMSIESLAAPAEMAQQQAMNDIVMQRIILSKELGKEEKERDNDLINRIKSQQDLNLELLNQTALIGGLSGALGGIAQGFADGKLEGKEMFSSLLQGAMQALPALIAMAGVSNPFAMIGIGVGVTALLGTIKGAIQRFEEGGLIKGKYTGKDDILVLAQAGEFVVPRDASTQHRPKLEHLRQTGQWINNQSISMAGVERRLDTLINATHTQKTTAVKLEHKINVDKNKMIKGLEFQRARMAY